MKITNIKWSKAQSPLTQFIYPSKNPLFAWINAKDEKDFFVQASGWHNCRETFCDEIRTRTKQIDHEPLSCDINIKRTRIAMLKKISSNPAYYNEASEFKHWAREACRLVNILEKYMGWSLTRVYKIKDQTIPKARLSNSRIYIYLFVGSPKWSRSPQLLSLFLLNLRLGRNYGLTKCYKKSTDLKKLATVLLKQTNITGQQSQDITRLSETCEHWETVMDEHKKLFFTRPALVNFRMNRGIFGISKLVKGGGDDALIATWKDIQKAKKG